MSAICVVYRNLTEKYKQLNINTGKSFTFSSILAVVLIQFLVDAVIYLGGFLMNKETLTLFKTLTELQGAPGNEHAVRNFMKQELEKYSDEIIQDNLGGVFGVKKW